MSDTYRDPRIRRHAGPNEVSGSGGKPRATLVLALLGSLVAALAGFAVRGDSGAELTIAATIAIAVAIASVDAAAVALLMCSLALVQPFALGAGHTILGAVVACGAASAAAASDIGHKHERASAPAKSVLIWAAVVCVWTVALATQHVGLDLTAAERTLESMVAVVGAGVVVLRKAQRRLWFSRALIVIMAGFCASYLVTLALWFKDGFGSHLIGGISVRGYGTNPVYFPLTPTSGVTLIHGRLVPRLLGPLREPGLCQVFLLWSFFMTTRVGWRGRSLKTLLLLGVLATQSTAGLGVLLVVWVLTQVIMGGGQQSTLQRPLRQLGGLVVLALAMWVAVFAPTIGVQAKQATNGASVSDRWVNTRAGLETLIEAPLGRDYTEFAPNVGINMLAATTTVGAPGLAFGLILFLRPMRLSRRRLDSMTAGLPLFLTALVAQPVLDAPAYFVVFMAGLLPYALSHPSTIPESPVPEPGVADAEFGRASDTLVASRSRDLARTFR